MMLPFDAYILRKRCDETSSTKSMDMDETLALFGTSMATIDEAIVDPPTSGATRETLQKKRDILEQHRDALLSHTDRIRGAVNKIGAELELIRKAQWKFKRIDSIQDSLIHFTDVIERANQYFEFKKTAREKYNFKYLEDHSPCRIQDITLHDQQLKLKFNKLDKMDIENGAEAIFWEVTYEDDGGHGGPYWCLQNERALNDWIFKLVFEARENVYAMDENPIVELEKRMISEPYLYDNYFLRSGLQVNRTEILIEKAHNKYSQFLKEVKVYRDTKLALEKTEDVTNAGKMS